MFLKVVVIVALFGSSNVLRAESAQTLPTKSVMHGIFEPVSELTPLSLQREGFSSVKNRKKIKANLEKLAANAGKLETHAKGKDIGFQFLSHSLARDSKESLKWFNKKRYDESQFVFNNLTENCIACHSQRAGASNFPPAAEFFKKVDVSKLPLLEKAQFQVATRQFDDALTSYEAYFASSDMTPSQMSLMEAFPDYLKLCIRIKADPTRAIAVLEKWKERPGVPDYMVVNINYWTASLREINDKKYMTGDTLATAEKLFQLAQKDPYITLDRSKLIYFIATSGVLQRFLAAGKGSPADIAEAYYLSGICESVIGRSFWISETEFFLEAAIRAAPGTATAEKAYAVLEEQIYFEFSGSSGTHIPEDMKVLLEELRKLAKNKTN